MTPENTLPAFQSALDVKSDLVELDYYHSAEGVPVVIHDEFLDRTTNAEDIFGKAKVLVGDQRVAELQKLDVGFSFDAKFAGTKLPTLVESLDLIQSAPSRSSSARPATLLRSCDYSKRKGCWTRSWCRRSIGNLLPSVGGLALRWRWAR